MFESTVRLGRALHRWLLYDPKTARAFAWVIVPFLLFNIAWDYSLDFLLQTFGLFSDASLEEILVDFTASDLFASLLIAPLEEEFLFRALPLWVMVRLAPRWTLIPVIVAISILFGMEHGGFVGVLFQGVGALTFSVFYLKCGGMKGAFLKPFLAVTLLHAAINGRIEIGAVFE